MKFSQLYIGTNKIARTYDSVNATLLTKAGFIDQVMSGVYTYLPLGLRVLVKIEQIVREEMDTIGVEVLMPTLAPIDNWQQTGRLTRVSVLLKAMPANILAQKVHNQEYIVSPSHEEIVTPLVKQYIQSYKDIPCAFYQIQTKFRNEPRAKSGLLRGREFRMKDLYSFHASIDDFKKYYEQVKKVYMNVFSRLGIGADTLIALASGGDFTEEYSHEFQTRCETGEDTIFYAPKAAIAFNKEVAPARAQVPEVKQTEAMKVKTDVLGEGIVGVTELVRYLRIPVEKTTKTLLYETDDGRTIAAAIRGDYSINEYKLCRALKTKSVKFASNETVKRVTNAEAGYAGVLNLTGDVELYFDDSCQNRINFETGANRTNYHTINVNFERDLPEPRKFYDFKVAKIGDRYPETGEVYEAFQASEVGNIFALGSKYANDFGLVYRDDNGAAQEVIMGCYGIGTSRLMGVVVEKFHDEHGIVWPKSIAPYHVHLVSIGNAHKKAMAVYSALVSSGIEVIWDDRDESAGVKFTDYDLIGIPWRLVVSPKTGDQIEVKNRSENESKLFSINDIITKFKNE
ncbi:proline--tRNA ligase [Candidatus Gottesmanbacteria bacterium RBG_16_43_7]|uniref:Proline--tRNA ligase n=1 Tax=Candidatus Gottesmanbacteria bacterium RBG_16_43_7 TaxID=1798373 RepID=A0A1F5ZCA2_9BACT|nr:MAG: proline--tRNA ligase [Candidatus Gottesmanbacteria bacterium RBG_16_43_7]